MSIFRSLLLFFIVLPLVEIYVMVKVGGVIGAWPTVAWVVAAAVLGVVLIRLQGLLAWRRAGETLARGQLPAVELLEGVVVLIGGVLLLIPGFVSDAVGALCLLPPLRRRFVRWLLRHAVFLRPPRGGGPAAGSGGQRTIEGDYRRDDDPRLR